MARDHAGSPKSGTALIDAVARLSELYDSEGPIGPTTPFEIIVWKNVGSSYSATYREATAALSEQGKLESEWLCLAFRVLRAHGRALR